ncbi:MAG TPA: MFS transporter [Microcella sp.]|nr:MFS transporter [Microcella sp.]
MAPESTSKGPFRRFWAASTVSTFGQTALGVALPVLVVVELEADAVLVGVVNAAQFVPYAVLGLVAGVYVDRWPRRTTLIVASLGRALCLAVMPILWLAGSLTIASLVVLLVAFGAFSVFGFAASQSLLPQIVQPARLLRANAQLDQGEAAALTAGPSLAGLLVQWLGAPLAIVASVVTYLTDAVVIASLRVTEAPRQRGARLFPDMREGWRAAYGHPVLRPLFLSTHVWFVANAASVTVLSLFALRTLDLSPIVFGALVSVTGAATLLGASIAERLGTRFGEGRTITGARMSYPLVWIIVALVPSFEPAVGTAILFVALAAGGVAAGAENPSEMSYRQRSVPDHLLGRVNATGRAVNRTAAAVGAIIGGALAGLLGEQTAIWIVASLFAVAAAIALFSPVKNARA